MLSSHASRVCGNPKPETDWRRTSTPRENVEAMAPAKKKASARRETHLGIRLTTAEATRLRKIGSAYPALAKSDLARIALLKGLDLIEQEGITLPPPAPRS